MLLSFMTYGMHNMELRDSIREGYTALGAQSRQETQALRAFLNTSVDPMEMIILLLSKSDRSMHVKEKLDEAADIVNFIYNMTVVHKNRRLTYKEMCAPHCFANELFEAFKVKRFFDFGEDIAVDRGKPLESQITNMEHVELIVLFPYGFKNTTELQTAFAAWELGVHDWTKKYNKGLIKKNSKVEVLVSLWFCGASNFRE
ncbi:hypothetical protein COOONC_02013 [Cooperia oncophora]